MSSDNNSGGYRHDCIKFGGAMELCLGDIVNVHLKGYKGIMQISGTLSGIGEGGFLISDGTKEYFVRASEIRMIVRPKSKEGKQNG